MKKSLLALCLIAFSFGGGFPFQDSLPNLTGPYLGQKPPGLKPEIFARGIISTEMSEGCSGWGNEINSDKSENRPYVSPDGKYLFYTSTKTGNRDIYWVDAQIIDRLKQASIN